MNKDNIFKSSNFHMSENDILHILITGESYSGEEVLFTLNSDGNEDEVPGTPIALPASDITSNSFTANWNFMENSTGYYLDVSTSSTFATFVGIYNNLDVLNVNNYSVIGLVDGVNYYYRIRAYNDVGYSVNRSNVITTITEFLPVTDFDGNVYTPIIVGDQVWVIENLKTTSYANGVPIPNIVNDALWSADVTGAYCWYSNDPVTYADYGCLYNWYAVDNINELAPTGWRIPSEADYNTLIAYLGGNLIAGGKLKEVGIIHWDNPNVGATDEIGFSGLGGGTRYGAGFFLIKTAGYFWTTDIDIGSGQPINKELMAVSTEVFSDLFLGFNYGASVRFMRDL